VADLAWAVGSKGLCRPSAVFPSNEWYVRQREAFSDVLDELLRNPTPLSSWIGQRRDRRLGAYFEALVGYWLSQHPEYRLIAQNVQIVGTSRTLGELDFVFADGLETVHLEVAVKLYLGIPAGKRWVWVGPSLRDRLDLKLAKLTQKQTRLTETEACQRQLARLGIPVPQRAMIMLKGMLFRPQWASQNNGEFVGVGNSSPQWTWMGLEELPQADGSRWEILDKPNWLAAKHRSSQGYLDVQDLRNTLVARWERFSIPCLVVRREPDTARELSRHFIVPSGWYELAQRMAQSAP
jgi:uncharacterized protein